MVGTLDQTLATLATSLSLSGCREVLRGVVGIWLDGGDTAESTGNLGDDASRGALAALLSPVGHARETQLIVKNMEPVLAVGVSAPDAAI